MCVYVCVWRRGGWRKIKLIIIIKGDTCREKGDVVKPRLFYQRAIIQEICNKELLEKVACSQKQDVSAYTIISHRGAFRLQCATQSLNFGMSLKCNTVIYQGLLYLYGEEMRVLTKKKEKKFSFFATREMSGRLYHDRPLYLEDLVQFEESKREYVGGKSDTGLCICSSTSFYHF